MSRTAREARISEIDQLDEAARELTGQLLEVVRSMKETRGREYLNWLQSSVTYLRKEAEFSPYACRRFSRGEVVLVDFGYNIGAELRGEHPAAVVEDNAKSDECVVVVPFSSVKPNEDGTLPPCRPGEVFIGTVRGLTKENIARPVQIRAVSKLRIIRPVTETDRTVKLTTEQLALIEAEVVRRYTFAISKADVAMKNDEVAVTRTHVE